MDYPHMTVIRPTPFRTMFFGGPDRPWIDTEFTGIACSSGGDRWHVEVAFTLTHRDESYSGRAIWSPVSTLIECESKVPYLSIVIGDHRPLPPCLEPAVIEAARRVLVGRTITEGLTPLSRFVVLDAVRSLDMYECNHDSWKDAAE